MTAIPSALELLRELSRRGLRLEPCGSDGVFLSFNTDDELEPEFMEKLSALKPALLPLLRAKRHLASQVLAGEFDDAENATRQAVIRELNDNRFDLLCFSALHRLTR